MEFFFSDGNINLKILFLNVAKLTDFVILMSKLFHSMEVDWKKEFLKKLCLIFKFPISYIISISCVI